jgi:hypothetical protein
MHRTMTIPLATTIALALGACGSDGGNSSTPSVSPEAAKSRIERAAHVTLAAERVPGEAREQGLRASYSNSSTAVKDEQVVGLFVMKDADVVDEVSDQIRASAPKSAKLIVNGEVMVVYAAAGSDRSRAIERAVKAL